MVNSHGTPGEYERRSRTIKDGLRYALAPAVEFGTRATMILAGNLSGRKFEEETITAVSKQASRAVGTLALGGITLDAYASERAVMFDFMAEAYAAETGKKPESMKELAQSNNPIIREAANTLSSYTGLRLATDLSYYAPQAVGGVLGKIDDRLEDSSKQQNGDTAKSTGQEAYQLKKQFEKAFGSPIGDTAFVWGVKGFAQYTARFTTRDTAYKEVHDLGQDLSLGIDANFNQVFKIAQYHFMTKSDDKRFNQEEKEAIRPIIDRMVHHLNHTDNFDTNQVVYLVGLDKIGIHGADGQIDQAVIKQSLETIDRLAEKGLDAIYREKAPTASIGVGDGLYEGNSIKDKFMNASADFINPAASKMKALMDQTLGERTHRMQFDQHNMF